MAAHRYWRATGLESYDGGSRIELSEFWLLVSGARVDAAATLTSSMAPLTGTPAALSDGDTATGATLDRRTVLLWDFGGSPQDVSDIRLGAQNDARRFPLIVRMQWSDDASAWTDLTTFAGIAWPGPRSLTASVSGAIQQNLVKGRAAPATVVTVPSQGAALAFSGAILRPALRARPNFFFNPAARGRLAGTVKKDVDPVDLPLRRRVRLYRDVDGLLIAETWSRESDGAYAFDYIEEDQAYTVIAIDHEHNYRAVVADNLTLVNGGVELIA